MRPLYHHDSIEETNHHGLEPRRRVTGSRSKGKSTRRQWGKLTDDDLDQIAGKRDQLEGKIQERYGVEKDRVKSDVDSWYAARAGNRTIPNLSTGNGLR